MKNCLFALFLVLTGAVYAQDQLFKKDNSKIEVKILEINQNEIKYKLFTYQDGPTITISKKDVALIIYQNGVHEVLNAPAETTVVGTPMIVYNSGYSGNLINRDSIEKAGFANLTSTKNIVFLNIMEPLNGSFGVSYVREFAQNYLNLYIPVSVGFAAPYFSQSVNTLFSGNNYYSYGYDYNSTFTVSDFRYTTKSYEAGLGLHFQTSGKHAVTHFIGPYIGMSQFKGTYVKNAYYYDPTYGYSSYNSTNSTFTLDRLNIMLDNGVLFRVTKNFNIMLLAAIGYHVDTFTAPDDLTKAYNFNRNQIPLNAFKFGLSFGYRF